MAPCGDTGTAQRYRDTLSDTPSLRHPRPAPARGRPGADGGGSRSRSGPRPTHSYLAPASPGKKEALTSRARRGASGAVTSRRTWRSFRFRRLLPGTPGEPRDGRARGEAQRGAGSRSGQRAALSYRDRKGRVCKGLELGRDRGMRGSALTAERKRNKSCARKVLQILTASFRNFHCNVERRQTNASLKHSACVSVDNINKTYTLYIYISRK